MNHPFSELRLEYHTLLQQVVVAANRTSDVDFVAKHLLSLKPRYELVSNATGVPVALLATLHQRESGADFSTYLGNGEKLTHVTTLVPKGRGPWSSWEAGAVDAIQYEHMDHPAFPWSLEFALYEGEAWNGFGPRNHGRHTGYLWSGTNIYDGGKYVQDGRWDPNFKDPQLGIVPVMLRMMALDPSVRIGPFDVPSKTVLPAPIVPAPPPIGVGGDKRTTTMSTSEIQHALNFLGFGPLLEDGSYGRQTAGAVREFQQAHGLTVDGLAGESQTIPALRTELTRARA